jgi:hypothetical protein
MTLKVVDTTDKKFIGHHAEIDESNKTIEIEGEVFNYDKLVDHGDMIRVSNSNYIIDLKGD